MTSQEHKPIESPIEKLNKFAFNYISSRSPLAALFMCAVGGAIERISPYIPAPQEVGLKQLDTGTVILTALCSTYSLSSVTLTSVFETGVLFSSIPQTAAALSLAGITALTAFECHMRAAENNLFK